ncbi:MAG: CBS domain-containing protein [Acidimicrobiales bacterium]
MTAISISGSSSVSLLIGDEVVRADAKTPLADIAKVLVGGAMGAVVLGDGDRPEAIVSERDLVAAMAAGLDPAITPAIEVATTELVWCDVDSTIDEVAAEMMERYIRHVLVEDGGRLVGMVSGRDLLAALCAGAPADDE